MCAMNALIGMRCGLAGAVLLLVAGCSGTGGAAPSPTPTDTVTSASALPSPTLTSVSATASTTATSSVRATPTSSGTASPQPNRTPRLTLLTCKPSVSTESGDPIILVSYRVADPARTGWSLTISYSNEEGRNTETLTGRGNASTTFKLYGSADPSIKPNCKASIRAR